MEPLNEEWFVLLNPFAAGGKGKRNEKFIRQQLTDAEIRFEFTISNNRDEGTRLIRRAIEAGFRKFISIGGDGTFNSIVNGIFSQEKVAPSEITLSIIPCGTGNDWIKTQHIPNSISKAIEIIKLGKTAFHDVGRVKKTSSSIPEVQYFINVAGFGFEGFVAERIEGKSKWLKVGFAAFIAGLLDALFRYQTTTVKISWQDQVIEGKFFNISAGICRYSGGGMKLAPDAIITDGLLDIVVSGNLSRWEVLKLVPRLFTGSYVTDSKISQYRTSRMTISSSPMLPVETDGELMGYGDAEVECLPVSVKVIVP